MKYFAKYLPVEEEIKGGDTVINKESQIFKCSWIPKESTTKKVKLFLCSKDIQIGDKVKWFNDITQCEDTIIDEFGPHHWRSDKGVDKKTRFFKVIGEISSQATWVKQGDEFDEEDINLVDTRGLDLPEIFMIKCLTCKIFH